MLDLSESQVAFYQEQGYLILRSNDHNLVNADAIQSWTDDVAQWPREKGKWMPYDEINSQGERQLMRTEKFADYHDQFRSLLYGADLGHILKQLSGEEMILFKDKINYKSSKGNGFQPHLDAPAYDHIGKIEHVTANFAIDAATLENGCLEIVPASHRMNVELADGGRIAGSWVEAHEWVSVPLEPGDVLIFGSHLAHRSGPNNTERRRASLYATFSAKSEGTDLRDKYYAHRRIAFPPDHEREVGKDYSQGWKTYGFAAPFSKQDLPTSAKAVVAQ